MINKIYIITLFIIFFIMIKIIIGLTPLSPAKYYTSSKFQKLILEIENNNTNAFEELILYINRNYDTVKEKTYNLKLLKCHNDKFKINVLEGFFERKKELYTFIEKGCPQEPLKLLNGHHSLWKYIFESFLFNRFPE